MGIRFGQRLCQSYGRKQQSTHSNFLEKIKETRFHEVPGKECLVTKATMGQLDTAVVIVIILHPLLKKMYLIWGNKKLLQWQVVLTFRPPQQSYPLWNTSSIFTRMMGLLTCTYCRLTFFCSCAENEMLELYQTSVGFSGLRPRIDFTIYIFFRSRKKKISVNNNLWHIWDAEILKEKHSKYSCYPSQSLLQRGWDTKLNIQNTKKGRTRFFLRHQTSVLKQMVLLDLRNLWTQEQ